MRKANYTFFLFSKIFCLLKLQKLTFHKSYSLVNGLRFQGVCGISILNNTSAPQVCLTFGTEQPHQSQ